MNDTRTDRWENLRALVREASSSKAVGSAWSDLDLNSSWRSIVDWARSKNPRQAITSGSLYEWRHPGRRGGPSEKKKEAFLFLIFSELFRVNPQWFAPAVDLTDIVEQARWYLDHGLVHRHRKINRSDASNLGLRLDSDISASRSRPTLLSSGVLAPPWAVAGALLAMNERTLDLEVVELILTATVQRSQGAVVAAAAEIARWFSLRTPLKTESELGPVEMLTISHREFRENSASINEILTELQKAEGVGVRIFLEVKERTKSGSPHEIIKRMSLGMPAT